MSEILKEIERSAPILHLMVGIQASGKSTLARNLHHVWNAIVLEPDGFREILCGNVYNKLAEDLIWANVKLTTRVQLRRGASVILDATSVTKHARAPWIRMAKEEGADVRAHFLPLLLEKALIRNAQRPHPVPQEHVERYAKQLQHPEFDEGFHTITIYHEDGASIKLDHNSVMSFLSPPLMEK